MQSFLLLHPGQGLRARSPLALPDSDAAYRKLVIGRNTALPSVRSAIRPIIADREVNKLSILASILLSFVAWKHANGNR